MLTIGSSNICRLLNSIGGYIYGSDDLDGVLRLTLHLFVGGEVTAGSTRWRIDTDWPWDGLTRLRQLDWHSEPVILRLRIPEWADGNYQVRISK